MDIFYGKRKHLILAGVLSGSCCILMVVFPQIAMDSARKGISLWGSSVLPALLPFFICANFLQNIGVIRYLKSGTFPFLMSVLSGYPMGAKIVGDLRRSGEISVREAKRLMSFCSTSGPAFLIGAVGTGMLGSGFIGGIIAASHYLGAVVNGMVYTAVLGKEGNSSGNIRLAGDMGVQDSLTNAMLSAFKSLGIILAYIVLFTFATDMLHLCGAFSLIGCPCLRAVVKGFFEMTVGCGAVAECRGISSALQCILCTGILSWGGLSVLGQSMSMLSGSGISLRYLFYSKLTHSLFSVIIAFLLSAVMV